MSYLIDFTVNHLTRMIGHAVVYFTTLSYYRERNDRSSPTCRPVNLHVGVANPFIPNNVQTANA